jgi:ABC-2 type transport system ATP-binding protein
LTDLTPAVRTRDIEVVYQRGGEPAVQGVSFDLAAGEAIVIAGDRGSGKSSLLRALLGLTGWTGEIAVLGGHPGEIAVQRRVGYAPEGRGYLERHTPREIVRLVSAIRTGRRAADVAEDALTRAGLPEERRGTRTLEIEEVRRTALACALAADPQLLVLDDPWEFVETEQAIARARGRGAAVIVASHEPGGFPAMLGRTLMLKEGRPE